ncbi:serine protease inhibitor 2-like isoform X5 [Eleutherodactylus coqui]|uniref:serine protease inhibitor 2-like isoform X5 n=1 Tax=Eleutherodactylus coqui TaxID=57060 RepID=UPI0034631E6A
MEIYCKEVQPADTHRALYNPAHPCTSRRPIRHITQDEGETPELTMRPVSVLLLVSLIAAVILINVRAESCSENQTLSKCDANPKCQANCTFTPKMCDKRCVPGCICVEGYVIRSDQDKRCIRREECPK